MPIEIRQLVIKSTVGEGTASHGAPEVSSELLAQVKAEIIADCRAWFQEQVRRREER